MRAVNGWSADDDIDATLTVVATAWVDGAWEAQELGSVRDGRHRDIPATLGQWLTVSDEDYLVTSTATQCAPYPATGGRG